MMAATAEIESRQSNPNSPHTFTKQLTALHTGEDGEEYTTQTLLSLPPTEANRQLIDGRFQAMRLEVEMMAHAQVESGKLMSTIDMPKQPNQSYPVDTNEQNDEIDLEEVEVDLGMGVIIPGVTELEDLRRCERQADKRHRDQASRQASRQVRNSNCTTCVGCGAS
jgi:hypothetical protein